MILNCGLMNRSDHALGINLRMNDVYCKKFDLLWAFIVMIKQFIEINVGI